MRIFYLIRVALLLILFPFLGSVYAQTVTVNLNTKYQTIQGFGGMNHTTWIKDLNDDAREKAFGLEPGNIGLSILRMHVDPDAAQFKLELPTALYAIKKGAIIFGTPWNVPTALGVTVGSETHVAVGKYADYTNHLNSFVKYMGDNAAPVYAISVQNEPDYGEWTRWTADEMLNYVRNHAKNLTTKVMAPESFQFRRTMSDPLLNDATAAANFQIVGGHIYGGGLSDYPLAREKGKDVWMTEHLLGSGDGMVNNWGLALTVAKEISDCMKANFNAYVWWYIRRSYGLITDDGNVSDKGYAMTHFSKFIRPGAVRVEAAVPSLPLVDVTAYTADNSLVMVVINSNSTATPLEFNIVGANVTKLTKFTTTETKKVANEGDLTITNGAFSTSVDGYSITTFTSSAINGGKKDNAKPVAVAGDDKVIDDTEGKGSAVISLDATSSSDPDGTIQNYSWSLNGQQIAWTAKYDLTITVGEYDLVLTVTDNDGASTSDALKLSLVSTRNEEHWLESECGTVGANWQQLSLTDASNGKFVQTKPAHESAASASTDVADLLVYNFTTVETGNYKVWGRVITPTANDDSFWVKVDAGDWVMWNGILAGSTWHWDDVHNGTNDNTMFYALEPGEHTLSICMREDGAQLDKILISNTGKIPTLAGGTAATCGPTANEQVIGQKPSIAIYPNPTDGQVRINWNEGFTSFTIVNSLGQAVLSKQFPQGTTEVQENLDLEAGAYIVLLRNDSKTAVSRILVKK